MIFGLEMGKWGCPHSSSNTNITYCLISVAERNDLALPSSPTRLPLVPGPDIWSFLLSSDIPARRLGG